MSLQMLSPAVPVHLGVEDQRRDELHLLCVSWLNHLALASEIPLGLVQEALQDNSVLVE